MVQRTLRVWREFLEAREWARSLGLKSESQWRVFRKSGLPFDIPSNPNREYAGQWSGWGDWLGTGRIADQHKTFRTYEEASTWAKGHAIKTMSEWIKATQAPEFPDDIPKVPSNTYREQWTSWGNFLGTGYVHYRRRTRRSYAEAQEWAKLQGVSRREDWDMLATSGLIPPDIPTNLNQYYEEWNGWREFVGNAIRGGASISEVIVAHELAQFVTVADSIRSIPLKNGKRKRVDIVLPELKLIVEYDGYHWHKGSVEKDRLDNDRLEEAGWAVLRIREKPLALIGKQDVIVESQAHAFVKVSAVLQRLMELELIDPGKNTEIQQYLDARKLACAGKGLQIGQWRPFEVARDWARSLGLRSESEWRKCRLKNGIPNDIPSTPNFAYQADWAGWGDWLGTGNVASVHELRSFEDARAWVRKLGLKDSRAWRALVLSKILPEDIPSNPHNTYNEWVSWMDWLGTEKTASRKRDWLPFEEAVKIASALKLKSEHEWRVLSREQSIPEELPHAPASIYKREWKGWGYWLGTGNVRRGSIQWAPFTEARAYARSLGFKMSEWLEQHRLGNIRSNVPRYPDQVYVEEWKGWKDWLR